MIEDSRPIIGLTVEGKQEQNPRTGGKLVLNWNYAQAVADAGGIPILLPPTADPKALVSILDGLLIPGGLDIDAAEYGEENHPENELQDPSRYRFEKAVYEALPTDVPILGICYGCQFLNVAQGGSLTQHLPDKLGNDHHAGGNLEEYRLEPGSLVSSALGAVSVRGKSYHHQAIGKVGPEIEIEGHSEDGVVEALRVKSRDWAVGVQWHPERTQDDPAMKKLFMSFIERARAYKLKRHVTM